MINNIRDNEVKACIEWLRLQKERKTINTNHSSYGYKHIVEKWYGDYISNDSFKEAVRILGIKSKEIHDNIYIAISEKTVRNTPIYKA
jgi:hypothetical protein